MTPSPRFCEKCGKARQENDRFCQECGHAVAATAAAESAPTQPPPAFTTPPPPFTIDPPPPDAPTAFVPSTPPPANTCGGYGKILIGLLTLLLLGAAAFFRSSAGQNLWHKLTQGIPTINQPGSNSNPQPPVIPPALPDAPTPSQPSSEAEAERWLKQGYAKEQAGDPAGAIRDYQKALDLTGNNEIADRIHQLQQPPPSPPAIPPAQTSVLYKTGNTAAVANGATTPNRFSTSKPLLITRIMTYHWNNGRGRAPGLISLQHEDGTQYGPWQAIGENGQGGVPNAGWIVKPDIIIKPGTYHLLDNHPTSWSQNAGTGGKGMCEIQGIPQP